MSTCAQSGQSLTAKVRDEVQRHADWVDRSLDPQVPALVSNVGSHQALGLWPERGIMTMASALQPNAFEHSNPSQPQALILFVDDDEGIRLLMKMYLERQHFRVITAANGLDGLHAFKSNDGIRVVVADRNMPLMDGDTMIQEILKINPKTSVILASSDIGSYSQAVRGRADIALSKPYAPKDLVNAVRATL